MVLDVLLGISQRRRQERAELRARSTEPRETCEAGGSWDEKDPIKLLADWWIKLPRPVHATKQVWNTRDANLTSRHATHGQRRQWLQARLLLAPRRHGRQQTTTNQRREPIKAGTASIGMLRVPYANRHWLRRPCASSTEHRHNTCCKLRAST